jgi:5-methylcytosine-specific restriction endonuclease McrA
MNSAQRIDIEFIKRCEEFAKPYAEENRIFINNRNYLWRKNNPDLVRSYRKKYLNSEKGKKARIRVMSKRQTWITQCLKFLTKEEKRRIKELHMQRRKLPGYEIDHIIPICEGGAHHPNNLRIIPREENKKKGRKLA